MIDIKNSGYSYSKKLAIFSELDLSSSPGKTYGLLGKKGDKKSTFIKKIASMLFPTEGTYEVFGSVPQNKEVPFLKNLSFVPEECYLPNIAIQDLSLDQKKKILVGFALSANTKVLIMDEPTNDSDIPSKITFRNMIKDYLKDKEDRIVIVTSHQVRKLDELIKAIIIMDNGEVLLV